MISPRAKKLFEALDSSGIKQSDLAKMSGFNNSSIVRLRHGITKGGRAETIPNLEISLVGICENKVKTLFEIMESYGVTYEQMTALVPCEVPTPKSKRKVAS